MMASSEAADGALHGGRVRRNVLRLLKGRAASALLLLASTALMARSLSPESFGLVVLIHSYLLLVRGLVNLKPFEAIIRFGVPLLERGESDRLAQLLRLTFAVDVLLALAGTGLAVLFVSVAGGILPWDAAARQTVSLYCLLLLISASGTASGILRLFNRFDLLGLRQAMGPLAQLCGVALAWWCGGDYRHFLLAFGAGFFVEHIVLLWFGYAELRRQQPQFRVRGALLASRRERFPGLSRFFNIVYWQSNVDLIPKQVSVLLVGVLLGPAAAGLFRIAQQVARVVSVLALVLRQVLFP
ncbi:MAG: oligosaccharide flippase family protein, partial [Chromatocurvus sp.]